MRIDAISSDTSRTVAAQTMQATRPAQPPTQPAPKPVAPAKDADGDHDGDTGTKGALVDIDA